MLCWGRKRTGRSHGGFVLLELGMGYFSGEKVTFNQTNLRSNVERFRVKISVDP
jgi:hypothetical protein